MESENEFAAPLVNSKGAFSNELLWVEAKDVQTLERRAYMISST
jgi:hypothetical protein